MLETIHFFSRGKNNKCESCETILRKLIKTKYPGQIQRSEKAMATHSSTLAWKIPWMEEPGRLCSPWGCEKSEATDRLHFHFSLSCIGEGNGNLLQCSCLENPRDGGACGLPCSMGSHRVGHNWSDLAAAAADPKTPVSLESQRAV